ncbi:MAG: SIS domain-containing protein [Acidimicrobiia bacterium]
MCGIIAVLRRRNERPAPTAASLLEQVHAAQARLEAAADGGRVTGDLVAVLSDAAAGLRELDRELRRVAGIGLLVSDRAAAAQLTVQLGRLHELVGRIEALIDAEGAEGALSPAEVEARSAALIALKDVVWALVQDRQRTARAVASLAGVTPTPSAVAAYLAIQESLSAIDRLEVRGRDSAGLHVLVHGHDLQLDAPALAALVSERTSDELFGSGSVRVVDGGALSFVYKAAAEIGELGDNVRAMRAAIEADELLRRAVSGPDAQVNVLGHTRWASVGIISAANAHPLNSEEIERVHGTYVAAALNGDVDNFADLKSSHGLAIRGEITTDAKVIPTMVSRALEASPDAVEAFRRSVAQMEGSVAIGAQVASEPGRLLLALRGSGQALYVGVTDEAFLVASEPYGLVEVADRYLRLDGETPSDPSNPTGSRGQIVALEADGAGTLAGIRRFSYDGTELPVGADELVVPQITTRDIDRGEFPHFLLKEISESPGSFRKTLRGKLVDRDGALHVELGPETLPGRVRRALGDGSIRRVLVIGQGTAAVAGQALAMALPAFAGDRSVEVVALPATELSGFGLRSDLSDTLVVAISQSGTTTDTNRTVDLIRARGGAVIAIVNRRQSDLTDKADGVLYTSDGRDVEMSVASTKAFYSQIAAGFLLAAAIADQLPGAAGDRAEAFRQDVLAALLELPAQMLATLELRPQVADAARQFAPQRRYWAIVGNGPNRIAAHEVRIKLSELCYKSIACDVTEDKKHIDLSSEPLILVCAAGLGGSTADDVAKEVGIYRAHRAAPIVIASEGPERYPAALSFIRVPATHPMLAFVLSAMVGHLFGYEAALAIDASAVPLREARAVIERAVSVGASSDELRSLSSSFEPLAGRFFSVLRAGGYDGHLEASTAARVSSLLRYATGTIPLGAYQAEWGKVGTPAVVIDDLTRALTAAIDELTRPVDAIKHQAKTVTVGISRSDESLLETKLVKAVLDAGAGRDRLSYDTLRTLAALSPTVAEVTGYTRYRVDGAPDSGTATISVADRGGIALDLPLRTERNPRLRGTKHQVAAEQSVFVSRGRADGRLIIIVPELKGGETTGITLLHVRFHERVPTSTLRTALAGYRNRYRVLEDAVMETEPTFREDLLESVPLDLLFTEPITTLADRWRV